MQQQVNDIKSPLAAFYERESEHASNLCFVQPYPDGSLEELTWLQVADQVRRMAAHLISLDLPKGSRIALMSNNCAHWIMADLAIWLAGHVSVPLYPVLAASSIRQILEHSDAKVLFAGKLVDWSSMSAGVPDDVSLITLPIHPAELADEPTWNDIIANTECYTDSPDPPLDDLATIIYTSGTTGMPKGVMHSFRSVGSSGVLSAQMYQTGPQDRMLSYLPLAHVAERAAVEVGMLYHGFQVYFSNSLETFAADLQRAKPTLFFAVPRIWSKLQQRVHQQVAPQKLDRLLAIPVVSRFIRKKLTSALGMDAIRIGISGAAPLSTTVLAWYRRLGIDILEGYAMSENFAYSLTSRIGEAVIGSVGHPNPQVECKLSEQGEVLVKSPTNMMGYFKEPEITAETLDDEGFIHTGDKGKIDEHGRLTLTGRIKEIFKTSKGKYVAPAPIEDKLLRSHHIELVCVAGADLPQPIALLQLTEAALERIDNEGAEAKQAIQSELESTLSETNQQLDKHENLTCLVIMEQPWSIDNGMITPTLKIKREQVEGANKQDFESWSSQGHAVIWCSR